MKRFGLLLLLLSTLCLPLVAQDDNDADERLEEYRNNQSTEALREEVDYLLGKLASADPDEITVYSNRLIELGPSAIPLLEAANAEHQDDNLAYVIGILQVKRDGDENPDTTESEQGPIVYGAGHEMIAPALLEPETEELPEPDEDEVRKYLNLKFQEARQQYQRGNFRLAKRMVEAMAMLEPSHPNRQQWKLFKIACDEAQLQDLYVRPTVTVEKLDFDFGEKVTLLFKLKNISKQTITIPVESSKRKNRDEWESAEAEVGVAQFELHMSEFDWHGTVHTQTLRRHFNIGEDIVLQPGEEWEKTLDLSPADLWKNKIVLRVFTVHAWLRAPYPVEEEGVEAGDLLPSRRIHFPRARFRSFPVEQGEDGETLSYIDFVRHQSKGSLAALRYLIDNGSPSEIFLAAQLQQRDNLPAVVDMLISTLDRLITKQPKEKRNACMSALARITGQRLQFNAQKWREWWTHNKNQFGDALINPDY